MKIKLQELIYSFEWIVFLKVIDKKPLKTWEEFKMYEKKFGKSYPII